MNKVFKVIWSEARNAYVVVSEMAKSHGTKSCSTKKLLAMLIATGVMTCASMAPAMAANPAPDDKNVTIGKGAVSAPYDKQTGNVAIGENAKAWNGTGRQEAYVDFGQGGIKGGLLGATVKDGTKLPGSIAIGKNTVARSGSTMIGDHGYTGKIGDITIAPDGNGIMKYNNDVYSTTIGANSFNSGALASVTGAFSIASSKYDGSGGFNSFYAVQNTGATVYGSLNSIESATSNSYSSGIASSVLGFANRTQNANAALIWGTGNEVTNSIENIDIETDWNKLSVTDAQKQAIKAMQSSKYAGGSVLAIGGGNKADYTTYSELTGVQNKVTGTKAKAAKYDFVNGYQNTVTEASDVTVIGSKNKVTADGNKVIGDNHKVSGKDNVIFGSADQLTETTVNNAVVLGHNAKVTGEGGVALGSGSVADRANAVSVGRKDANRQIINVAAGTEATDAVNVSQLRDATVNANKGWNLATNGVATEATNVKPGDYVDFSGDQNVSISKDAKDGVNTVKVELNKDLTGIETISNDGASLTLNGTATELTNGKGAAITLFGDTTTINNKVTVYKDGRIAGVAAGINEKDAVNVGQLNAVGATANKGWNLATNGVATEATNVKPGEFVDFSGDKNISVSHDGTKVQVELNKNIDVNYVQTNALNAKYNLSVGTANENGTVPFLVTSTGAFYAANNNFSVDKGGKVIATAGEIGNVVLQNGVYTGNSALRDGELYVGDASGNYSQITTTGAKLGQVTIAADGKISGVAAGEADTDAVNVSQLHAVATEAGKHTTLSNGKNTTVESTVKDGQTDYKVNVAGDLTDITSVANGDSKINLNKDSIIISNGNKYFAITNSGIGMSYIGADYSAKSIMLGENGTTISGGLNVAGSKITGVAAGVEKTDAVNVGQLKDYVAANDTHIKSGNYAVGEVTDSTGNKSQGVSMDIVNKEGKVTGTVTITDVAKASDVGDVNNIASDIKNQDGSHTTVVDAVNNLNQKLDNKVGDLNYVEGGKGNYVTNGENTTTSIGKLDQALKDVAATAAKHTTVTQGDNITVTPGTNTDGSKNYNVALKKDITVESVTANTFKADQTVMNKDGLKVGNKVSVSATAVTAGQTSISNDGLKVNGKTYVSDSGLNANDQKITNVADGKVEKGSTDAVNGGQLYNETRVAKDGNFVKKSNTAGENLSALDNQVTANTESIYHMNGRISDLDNRVNKVGAGAAALAALHPLDFDPDAKWDFAAGYGNYRGANAAAVGAYYRPNEDTMFSVGGTFGNGENMVNAGISFKLGSGSSHVSTSRVAMAKEIKELRGELEAMKSAMLDANAGKKIDTSKLQLFPDVPQNHWAYEYVAQLAGNGMIEGYPDGNFAGDRPMTRYEFAAILYRAMTKGAVLSDKILSEFSHELEYFTVDTIAKDKAGNPTIQRVRTVKENKNK